MSNNSYLKFYWLERDFFQEIHDFFHNEHYLTSEQFFAIIFWKSIRPRKQIKQGLLANGQSLDVAVKNLTEKIFKADRKEKLNILLQKKGFRLAMASAVLTVLYPKDFTVYDYRVWNQIKKEQKYKDISCRKNVIELYFKFIELVKKSNPELSLRDCDRNLWAKSWYEDLQNFI